MKTAISLPDDLFEAIDRLAEQLGVPRSRVYQRALAAYLERHEGKAVTEQLNRVYSTQESGLDPVLDRMQKASLRREEW